MTQICARLLTLNVKDLEAYLLFWYSPSMRLGPQPQLASTVRLLRRVTIDLTFSTAIPPSTYGLTKKMLPHFQLKPVFALQLDSLTLAFHGRSTESRPTRSSYPHIVALVIIGSVMDGSSPVNAQRLLITFPQRGDPSRSDWERLVPEYTKDPRDWVEELPWFKPVILFKPRNTIAWRKGGPPSGGLFEHLRKNDYMLGMQAAALTLILSVALSWVVLVVLFFYFGYWPKLLNTYRQKKMDQHFLPVYILLTVYGLRL